MALFSLQSASISMNLADSQGPSRTLLANVSAPILTEKKQRLRELKWLVQGYRASKQWSWDLQPGDPKPKPRLFSPKCFVIWDKKTSDWNETCWKLLWYTYESSSIFCKHCRPPQKRFLNFIFPFFSPLALRKGQLERVSQYIKKVLLTCPNPQYHQWVNSIYFQKGQRSDGATVTSRPNNSSTAKGTSVYTHYLCFLSLTKWVRTASEEEGRGRGGKVVIPEVGRGAS